MRRRRGKPSEPLPAFDQALRLVAWRERSERELRRRLSTAGCASEQIDPALAQLKQLGYLDDSRFARLRARSTASAGRQGPRAIAVKLAAAGVARELVRKAIAEAWDGRDEGADAAALLDRRFPGAGESRDAALRARAARFLLRRGFTGDAVRRALRRP